MAQVDALPTYYPEVSCTRDELLAKVAAQMSDKRFKHCLGVEEAAILLAKKYGVDTHKAGLAGLLHDFAKELDDATFLELIDRYQLDSDLKNWNSNVWHGVVGRYYIQETLGLDDEAILHAIEIHTIGATEMTDLEKIVYVADYIESGRDFPGVELARALAMRSLDSAVAYETVKTVQFLSGKAVPIYPKTIETYNRFVSDYHEA